MKYALIAPALILAALFTLWPLAEIVRLSLTQTNFITTQWVGLANYRAAIADADFRLSILNSGLYIVLLVTMVVGGALVVALTAFPLGKRWHDATRFVFYIPALSAGVIISQVWRWIFHRDGPINWALGLVGAGPIAWASHWSTAIPMVSIVVATASMGGTTIIFLASMLAIDQSLFDAATIDGASRTQLKTRIVIPMISPTIGMMMLIAAIAAPQVFETIYAMAPYNYTATMTFHIYRQAFQMSRYGMASAQAAMLLVLLAAMTYVKQRLSKNE